MWGLCKSRSPILRNIKALGTYSIQMFTGLSLACSPWRWWSSLPPLSQSIFFFPLPVSRVTLVLNFPRGHQLLLFLYALWPTSTAIYHQLLPSPIIGPGRHRDLELISALMKTQMNMLYLDVFGNLTDLTSPHFLFSVNTCTKRSLGNELFSTYITFHRYVFILELYFKPVWLHAFVFGFCDVSPSPSL